ncbi:MAG: glycosyl transferase, partial [Mucilaginibacter sp.]|nr:glycosyl transferase [Mucilaginibacter sp.]
GNLYSENVLASYRVWTDTGKVRQKRKLEEIYGIRSIFDEVIEPAFETRGWDLTVVKSAREKFAINQSNCLGWNIYTDQEKIPLITALLGLSDTKKSRFFLWLYKKGYGVFPESYSKFNGKIRRFGKNLLLSLTKKGATQ